MTNILDNSDDLSFSQVPTTPIPTESTPFLGNPSENPTKSNSKFSFDYYKQFFDVSTKGFVDRLLAAANPVETNFFGTLNKKDLYGPVWITATVSFLTFALGTVNLWIKNKSNFSYHFSYLVWTFIILCAFVFGSPFLIWYIDKVHSPQIINTITLFGYSVIYLVPSSFLVIIFRFRANIIFPIGFALLGGFSLVNKLKNREQLTRNGSKTGIVAALLYVIVHIIVHFICFA